MNTEIEKLLLELKRIAPQGVLRADSRAVQTGDVFFAFPIAVTASATQKSKGGDGRAYIQAAIAQGAAAIVYEAEDADPSLDEPQNTAVPYFSVAGLAQQLGHIAHAWYGAPSDAMQTIAVTGTNGKTSCSQWIAKALSATGEPCAVIGTLGVGLYRDGQISALEETGFTTPDALQLQTRLAALRDQGARGLAIEASSIGLVQGRMNGLQVDVAMLTNLTRDHLDFHHDMEAYAQAKAALFAWTGLKAAVINLDDAFGEELCQQLAVTRPTLQRWTYGIDSSAALNLRATHIKTNAQGTQFLLEYDGASQLVRTQMIGRFNVSNVLGVLGVLLASGMAINQAIAAVEKLSSVQGRMQQLGGQGQVMAVVDYAHTPDALEKALHSLQEVAKERQGKLWCVFGCGGDRDPGKRPQMGRIAQLAQHVIVTSDNPRSEEPGKIIADILAGMQSELVEPTVLEDRANAILYAIKHAQANDVVLIAGKGHEEYQEVNGKKNHFSDEEHARLALISIATNSSTRRKP